MLPVIALVLLASTQCLTRQLQKTAAAKQQDSKLTVDTLLQNESIPERIHAELFQNKRNIKATCPNCGHRNSLPVSLELEKMRIEVIKQQILQGLQMTQPPNIRKREFSIPPPLLKRFQEEKDKKRQKEEQPPEIKSEVVLLGNRVSLPRRSKLFGNPKKVKVAFHVSYKVYTTKVHSAKLWIRLSKSRHRQGDTELTIKDADGNARKHVIKKNITHKSGWVSINIKKLVKLWKRRVLTSSLRNFTQNHTLEMSCSDCDQALQSGNNSRPFIVIDLISVKSRRKRSINCRPGIQSCCLQELYVSFADMGWDNWILIPEGFNVNYCTGSCYGHILPVYSHSGLLQKVALQKNRKDMAPCCSPTKLAPLSILYFDQYENIFQQDIDNMSVQRCGCS